MLFYGASSQEGTGVGIVFIPLKKENHTLSYKLEVETTNKITKYEALLLGLEVLMSLKL